MKAVETEIVEDNGYSFSDILARGTVASQAGEPLRGAAIVVHALAGQDVRAGLKVGESFELTPVASATTAADGSYALELDYAALERVVQANERARQANLKSGVRGTSRSARAGEQKIDLDISIASADGSQSLGYGATVSWTPGTEQARMGTLVPAPGVEVPTAVEAKSRALRTTTTTPGLDFTLDSSRAVSQTAVAAAAAAVPNSCTLRQNLGDKTVYTGQTSATVSGGYSQKWSQTIGSSTSVSQGLSLTGAYGSWTKGSTVTAQTTSETTWPSSSSSGARVMATQYTFGKYYCVIVGTVARQEYRILPSSHWGGTSTIAVSVPSAPYCASYVAGSAWSKSTSNAITYSNGVQLANTIGANLSARTGFTSSAKYSVTFTAKRNLCGVSGGPGTSAAYQLVVKP